MSTTIQSIDKQFKKALLRLMSYPYVYEGRICKIIYVASSDGKTFTVTIRWKSGDECDNVAFTDLTIYKRKHSLHS